MLSVPQNFVSFLDKLLSIISPTEVDLLPFHMFVQWIDMLEWRHFSIPVVIQYAHNTYFAYACLGKIAQVFTPRPLQKTEWVRSSKASDSNLWPREPWSQTRWMTRRKCFPTSFSSIAWWTKGRSESTKYLQKMCQWFRVFVQLKQFCWTPAQQYLHEDIVLT